MTPFKRRNFFVLITVILFAVFLYGIHETLPALRSRVEHLEFIAIALLLLMSTIMMFFWSLLGVFTGLVTFLLSMIFLYRPLTDLNPYYFSVLIVAFFMNNLIGYHLYRKTSAASQQYTVKSQKIQEDTNLIVDHLKGRENEVDAMEAKIGSLLKLKNIADRLSLSLDDEDILKIVSEETFELFGKETRVLLFIFDEKKKELKLSSTVKGDTRKSFEMKHGGMFDKWVQKNMKSLMIKDVRKDFRFSVNDEESNDDAVSLISKPLMSENNLIGILRVDSARGEVFEQHELRILDIVGDLAAVAFENARLYGQTEELAIRDSLTGLFVHRYFMERFDEEVKRAVRSGVPFALFMLDIDNFKDFNDRYGHVLGDAILKNIGRILRAKSSAGDIVARYGGEEFAFLMLNCGKKDAGEIAEEIRKEIQEGTVVVRREKYSVTVSIGVSVFPDDAKSKDELIWEADRCLYQAKTKGKNRVCSK